MAFKMYGMCMQKGERAKPVKQEDRVTLRFCVKIEDAMNFFLTTSFYAKK